MCLHDVPEINQVTKPDSNEILFIGMSFFNIAILRQDTNTILWDYVRKLTGFTVKCGGCRFIPSSLGMQLAWPDEPEAQQQLLQPAHTNTSNRDQLQNRKHINIKTQT
jgi:hypothetical protein